MRLVCRFLPLMAVLLLAVPLAAQPGGIDAAKFAQLQQQVADAKGSADNAWMVTSSSLVLMIKAIADAARTREIGDGKIFLTRTDEAIRIRNEERGESEL